MQSKNKSLALRIHSPLHNAGRWLQIHLERLTTRHLIILTAGSSMILCLGYAALSYWPRHVTFSYASSSCTISPTILPALTTTTPSQSFTATPADTVQIAGYPVYAHRVCAQPRQTPQQNTSEALRMHHVLLPFAQKRLTIAAPSRPELAEAPAAAIPVAVAKPLTFQLEQADRLFSYQLTAGDKVVSCQPDGKQLTCDTTLLSLAQSATYTFSLTRTHEGMVVDTMFSKQLRTVEAVGVTGSSIGNGQMVYDAPNSLTVTLNKPVTLTDKITLTQEGNAQPLAITPTVDGTSLTVTWQQALPRATTLLLTVGTLIAADDGFLPAPYTLTFRTSGGPKVLGTTIGSYKVSPSAAIALNFDSAIGNVADIGRFVRLEVNGAVAAATVAAKGRSVTITPHAALPRCATLKVQVLDGLQNEFGISGGSAWQFSSRALCQTVFSIGTSAQGRSITAYRFGGGSSTIVYVGGTHGNEKSSAYIMQRWVDYLEANAPKIPGHRSIVVIPVANPDGYATGNRLNANNVDLNRNFPANNWKAGVTMPDKSYHPNGGGTAPLSEPESRALANYVLGQKPRLVLTYHASGGVVVPNGSGDSRDRAIVYGKQSTVGFLEGNASAGFFEYDTTGAFEDWLHDKHGIPTLLIELLTKTNQEFSGHQQALWTTAILP